MEKERNKSIEISKHIKKKQERRHRNITMHTLQYLVAQCNLSQKTLFHHHKHKSYCLLRK